MAASREERGWRDGLRCVVLERGGFGGKGLPVCSLSLFSFSKVGGRERGRTGERNLDVTMDNGMKDGGGKMKY